jgi:proteasome lid subunit RPN8/RPN11
MRIARDLYEQIVTHARLQAPDECCGMVSARDGSAVKVYPAANIAEERLRRLRFEIGANEQLRIQTEIDDAGLDLGAIYHSHTRTDPRPSQTDINFARNWPGVLWIIVGVGGAEPEVRTWRIDDGGQVTEAELEVR